MIYPETFVPSNATPRDYWRELGKAYYLGVNYSTRGHSIVEDMERHRATEGSTPSQKAGGKGEQASDVE